MLGNKKRPVPIQGIFRYNKINPDAKVKINQNSFYNAFRLIAHLHKQINSIRIIQILQLIFCLPEQIYCSIFFSFCKLFNFIYIKIPLLILLNRGIGLILNCNSFLFLCLDCCLCRCKSCNRNTER